MHWWKSIPDWGKWLIAAVSGFVLAWSFLWPYTRMVWLWLLPLGSGIDDLIVIVLLILGSVAALWAYITSRRRKR